MTKITIKHPCGGHNCQKYEDPQVLYNEILQVAKERSPIDYLAFLLELQIRPSTPGHGQTCRPNNLKLLEYVEMGVANAVSQKIKENPNLVIKYGELTRNRGEDTPKEKPVEINDLIKQGDNDDNNF